MREIRTLRSMFDGAGIGNQFTARLMRHSQRKRGGGATARPDLRNSGANPRPYLKECCEYALLAALDDGENVGNGMGAYLLML